MLSDRYIFIYSLYNKLDSIAVLLFSWGQINKCNIIFMVDWQFMVFCRKVGFVVIYTFLVLFFVAKFDLWVMTSFVLTDDASHAASTSACIVNNMCIIDKI